MILNGLEYRNANAQPRSILNLPSMINQRSRTYKPSEFRYKCSGIHSERSYIQKLRKIFFVRVTQSALSRSRVKLCMRESTICATCCPLWGKNLKIAQEYLSPAFVITSISANASGPRDAASCKIGHITVHAVCNHIQATSVGPRHFKGVV